MTVKDLLSVVKARENETIDGVYVSSLVEVVTHVNTYGYLIEVSLGRVSLDNAPGAFRSVLNEEIIELRVPDSYEFKIIISPDKKKTEEVIL